jgi:hypothetical protein
MRNARLGARNPAFFQEQKKDHESLNALYDQARRTGFLNLNAKGLIEIPAFLFNDVAATDDKLKFWELNPINKAVNTFLKKLLQ